MSQIKMPNPQAGRLSSPAPKWEPKIIAAYLTDNYAAEFERLNIEGCTVENFRQLAERIESDEALWNLRRLYAITQRELNRWRTEPQPKMEVIS